MFEIKNCFLDEINNGKGYVADISLTSEELAKIDIMIKQESLAFIKKEAGDSLTLFENEELQSYHKKLNLVDYKKIFRKNNRIFSENNLFQIKQMPFFKKIIENLGPFRIANEEEKFSEEIYWRLVRPFEPIDVGPLHADKWFWDLGHGKMPDGFFRLKTWIPIHCEPGGNGLKVVPFSHTKDYVYGSELRDGFMKPTFDESAYNLEPILLPSHPGQVTIFHDKLLHGGCVNKKDKSRVSIEFTMLSPLNQA